MREQQSELRRSGKRAILRGIRALWRTLAIVILAVLVVGWWEVLRIVEDDHWPPPPDAVASAQAQAETEAFIRAGDARRDETAMPFAPATASSVELFIEGNAFFPAIIADIEAAQSSVHIMMFGFYPGEWGTRIADALVAKQQAGVEVRVSVDRYGSKVFGENAALFDYLSGAGIAVVANDIFPIQASGVLPDRSTSFKQDEAGQADHRKIIVVDGRTGWIGGAGFEDHFATGRYHDVFVRVEGDVVGQMQAVFLTSYHAYGGNLPGDEGTLARYFPEAVESGAVRVTLVQNIPGGFLPATQASRAALDSAGGSLEIMNPYLTDPGMLDRIVDAAERGVRVRVLVSEASNNPPADAALRHAYPRLIEAGVEIWEHPAIVHAKVTVADDTLIVGTVNYDAWAMYRNLEIALVFEDAALAERARSEWVEPDIAAASPGVAPTGTREKIEGWFWDKLVYFL